MLKEFVVEALDLATNVEEHLLSLERNPDDMQTLNAVFRSFHTIKGGAGFMNLTAMVEACHLTENLFDALRTGKAPVTLIAIEAALEASGFVADQLKALHNGTAPDQLSLMPHALEVILTNAIEGKGPPAAIAAVPVPTPVTPVVQATQIDADGIDWDALYQAVVPAGTSAASTAASSAISPTAAAAAATIAAAQIPLHSAVPIAKVSSAEVKQNLAPPKEESIRIDAVKLDVLLEVAGESVQAANQAGVLLEKLAQFKFDDSATVLMTALTETLSRASRYSTELQRASLATRMQPVGRLFQKFPRLVRELAKDLEKDVDLSISGAETEVDRVVVDSLYDPLVHMLRNSLDHGIETREERALTKKPAKSVIALKAWQEASSVMIEVTDDGKGMDANRLRTIAISKGLIGENDARSHEEAYQLVFLPGFSTKEVASSVSGRGVGMDVVKTAVEKHRGDIRITSNLGTGTSFLIRLPIELSIVPTMLVRTSSASLALPMAVVQRVVELPEIYETVGGSAVLRDQGTPLPVRSLASILGYEPCTERVGIVIAADNPYILALESVDGTSDLVIKPLTCISTPGITGTARSAEGELVLVIGLGFLLQGCEALGAVTV
ncbi:chemotaxis protein CheA [Solimicrobium silvestre]|uniref:Chemotaxis protein CheA n=1 Tax=Solimicrobium silvestre TaxID=2099400 RepID=A0A2S9GUA0_9BURK|nr:chemotaxis protein CheA [Solimicrobium silvestre]PRC91307.1 Histidine kinase-, DNA gyrase B-, and HSP90-like ATPase [Solimicrobium silvestre]